MRPVGRHMQHLFLLSVEIAINQLALIRCKRPSKYTSHRALTSMGRSAVCSSGSLSCFIYIYNLYYGNFTLLKWYYSRNIDSEITAKYLIFIYVAYNACE